MAALTRVTVNDITSNRHKEVVTGLLANTGDTYASKFSKIYAVICTPADAEAVGVTNSGSVVTIAKTTSAYVNLMIYGD